MEIAIARSAFGGPLANPAWADLPGVPPLPPRLSADAARVRRVIGVSRAMRPREAITTLVEYFRGFADADDPPEPHGSVYLDLSLSKKGVCRHRSFAFLVTAESLGIPARLVLNEAHAWVEVFDGAWRRIDLGGAGRIRGQAASSSTRYHAPKDAFGWPENAGRGDELAAEPGPASSAPGANGSGPGGGADPSSSAARSSSAEAKASASVAAAPATDRDERPLSHLELRVDDADVRRGLPLHVRGTVAADGGPCGRLVVGVFLRDARTTQTIPIGSLATEADGTFAGGVVVPGDVALGDYEAFARTSGDARCGPGASQ